ncbi:MAG: hypothetical protein H6690_00100 [Erysipelotrichaceae bacterium]|nr:hypothetical protein [Erysipelotrichaceae bacterium]
MYSRWFIPAVAPVMIGSLTSIINHFYNNKLSFLFSKNLNYLLLSILLFCFPLYTLDILKPMSTFFQSLGISLLLLWVFYNQNNKLISVLEFKPLRYLGKISYGVYIFQGLFLGTKFYGGLLIHQFPLNIILTFTVAIVSYELIETRIMRFKKIF